MNRSILILCSVVWQLLGCSGAHSAERLSGAYREMARRDTALQWNDEACRRVATELADGAYAQHAATAHYRAGVVWERCGRDREAREQFEEALRYDPSLVGAQAELALFEQRDRQTPESLDRAIEMLKRLIVKQKEDDPDQLATLARLLIQRRQKSGVMECGSDLECAYGLLARALGKDPNHLPSRNQLAMYHLALAQESGGLPSNATRRKELLEGEVICEQASLLEPQYAPVHNTLGLILLEAGDTAGAADAFDRARSLDSRFFDAQMNVGALSSQIRDFKRAEEGYRQAFEIRPGSYEACLGLAEAQRELSADPSRGRAVREARATLEVCKKIAPSRPEAYYDEAILAQDLAVWEHTNVELVISEYERASELLRTFLRLAGSSSRYASKAISAKTRLHKSSEVILFLRGG